MTIFKRKKGEKEYFYLRHSYRKNGKTSTKEKYLGKEIPKNIEEIKKEFEEQFASELAKKLETIKANFQAEWRKVPASIKKGQLEEISIAFTYNTNAIEGSVITLEETRGILQDKISPHKSLRDIKETEAHARIFLDMLEEKEKISKELLFKWHKNIFSETKPEIAGAYRNFLASVGDYLAPDWQDIPELMNKFFEFLSSKEGKKMNPVELSAHIHYKFEKIHPFGDGNGRIGRLLLNYILWKAGYPLLIIEYRGRMSYYKALKKPENLFVKYLIRRYLAVHKTRVRLA